MTLASLFRTVRSRTDARVNVTKCRCSCVGSQPWNRETHRTTSAIKTSSYVASQKPSMHQLQSERARQTHVPESWLCGVGNKTREFVQETKMPRPKKTVGQSIAEELPRWEYYLRTYSLVEFDGQKIVGDPGWILSSSHVTSTHIVLLWYRVAQ